MRARTGTRGPSLAAACAAALLAAWSLSLAPAAGAQTARQPPAGGGAGGAQAQQLQAAMASLQAENARLKKELEDAKGKAQAASKEASGSKQGVASLRAALAQAQASKQSSEALREQTQARLSDLLDKYRQNTGALAGVETERGQLKQDLAATTGRLDTCAQRNVALYDAMNQALDKVGHGGFFTAMGRAEPFTKIERVRLENMVDEYRARAEELKLRQSEIKGPEKPARAGGSR
jgi:chromosome segregation ATPase